jgi:hypothetical protein
VCFQIDETKKRVINGQENEKEYNNPNDEIYDFVEKEAKYLSEDKH